MQEKQDNQIDTYWQANIRLGFWFSQQGSIYVFVVLIFVYINKMKKIERLVDQDESGEE